ncbi:MAG: protein translocase subunit SecD [Robiginitomaculum sp.]|nr:protein translocase subunit SecD [Robiginitomaculum sp.]
MLHFSRWKITLILGAIMLGLLFALPNVLSEKTREALPGFLPSQTLNLGLDLQGGAHLLLEVDLKDGVEKTLKSELAGMRAALREDRVSATLRIRDEAIFVTYKNAADAEKGVPIMRKQNVAVDANALGGGGKTLVIEKLSDLRYKVTVSKANIEYLSNRTIEQSIQVLRKRIDPSGTTEMTLAKEGAERILLQVPGAKNVDELKSVIDKTAKLGFHQVAVTDDVVLRLCVEDDQCPLGKVAYPQKNGGGYMMVFDREIVTGADLKSSSEGLHPQNNYPIVNFVYNATGARKFCDFTSKHVGEPFAVVLDGEIITAPNINGAICGGRGFIEGSFTMESAKELSLLLNAGALPAKLNIAEERTVGPELGADSINAGKVASMLGLVGVAIFMWLSYGLRFGTFANIALATNIVLIAGALSLLGATLTLPGIAGIILTIGMAVDANVLIFERIREETQNGRGPINAIDTGYRLSLAPILDANITTLIAALTLYFVGSGPIRGFAVTLSIGIVMSVFTAVVVARLMTATWLRHARPKKLPI